MNDITLNHLGKMALRPRYRLESKELKRLGSLPRHTPCSTKILGPQIELVDGPSFVPMYQEIFQQHIYKFFADTDQPLMIDGGANIGLGVLYLKRLYPHSKCIAFEPDISIFAALNATISNFKIDGVDLVNRALWNVEGEVSFSSEGSNAGSLVNDQNSSKTVVVKTVRLRDYLDQKVDFLKLDIEGAELEVLRDCADALTNVKNIFVEYHSFAGKSQKLSDFFEILEASGFRIFVGSPAQISPQPLYKRHTHLGMDMLLNVYGYRD